MFKKHGHKNGHNCIKSIFNRIKKSLIRQKIFNQGQSISLGKVPESLFKRQEQDTPMYTHGQRYY